MAQSRAPFVAVRTDIRKEERVGFIADHAGYNAFEAIGRLTSLWCWCTDRGLDDAPENCEGYAVPDAVVRRFLGPLGVEAILGDGCDELAMGERREDGLIYLRDIDVLGRGRGTRSIDAPRGPMGTYVIESPKAGVIKVGRTRDLQRRLISLQTANHDELRLFDYRPVDIEASLHDSLDALKKRVRGEWFVLDEETVAILAAHNLQRLP